MKNVGLELEDTVSGAAAGAELRAAPAQPTTGHSGAAHPGTEPGTRARIARLILEHGPVTAAGLSGRLGLTPAAVRRHLDNLLTDGMIEAREARCYGSRGRGRPARMFAITDAGRSAFEHAYDDLVVGAGGRVYLAKDSRVPADVLAQMYPRLAEFRALRASLDPKAVLASDLSRRLGL